MTKFKKLVCKINKKESGNRLDKALTNLLNNFTRSQIKLLIVKGKIKKSNTEFYDASYKVRDGEVYEILLPLSSDKSEFIAEDIPLNIIFEDNDIIVVNKNAGIVVHPAPGNKSNTLVNALLYHRKNKLSNLGNNERPGIVHRIDKDTRGIIAITKNNKSHNYLSKQFKSHNINRKYTALVWGVPNKNLIKGYIGRHKYNRKKMSMTQNSGARYSETSITIKKKFKICSLIECELKTGRTHQIRVHLESIGCPLIGDQVYGKTKIKNYKKHIEEYLILANFKRQALHAHLLGFFHPKNDKYVEFKSGLPKDFKELINYISKY